MTVPYDTSTFPVYSGGGGGGAVSSVFGRTGAVTAQAGDYTAAQVTGAVIQLPMLAGSGNDVANANAITAALAALPATGGVVRLPPGTPFYVRGNTVPAIPTGKYIDAEGCYIFHTGSGYCFDWQDTSVYLDRTVQGAGLLGKPVIDGANTTGAAWPVQAGDILQMRLSWQAQNYTVAGSRAGYMVNTAWFMEEASFDVFFNNCATGVVFDVQPVAATVTGSFDRAHGVIMGIQAVASCDLLVFQNGTYIDDIGGLHLGGNCQTSSTVPSSAVLRVTGQAAGTGRADPNVFSHLGNGQFSVGVECGIATGTLGPFTIVLGSSGNFIGNPDGGMSFGAGGANFQDAQLNGGQFEFTGPVIGDNTLSGTYVGILTTSLINMFGSGNAATIIGTANGIGIAGNSTGTDTDVLEVFDSSFDLRFSVTDTGVTKTLNNTLDDSNGNAAFAGIVSLDAGKNSSSSTTVSSPAFTSGTALQLNANMDTTLLIAVQTAALLVVAIGPTSATATTILPSKIYSLGLITIPVPAGWYVKITGTIADLVITELTL